MSLLATAMGL